MKLVFTNDGIYAYAFGLRCAHGGAERQQWLLSRALVAKGWSITVGVREGLEAGKQVSRDSVKFLGIGQQNIISAWHRFLLLEQPDWWYWRCADHLFGPAVGLAKVAGVRTIFSAALDRDVRPRHALFRRPRMWPLYAAGLSCTDRILVQHEGQLSKLNRRFKSKAYIVPSIASGASVVKPHSERKKYVAWVAMLKQVKRPDRLVEIARKASTIRFVVCGGPTTFMSTPGYGERIVDAFRKLPNIEYRGEASPGEAIEVIANAAVLLSTSDEEGFPTTFLEAWSSGTPVISSNIDPDHIIERAGLGVVSGSIEGVCASMNALVDSPRRREEISVRARRYVVESHSEAAVTSSFERAIREVRS